MAANLNYNDGNDNSLENLRRRLPTNSVLSNIPAEFIQIWSKLPEQFRYDSSLSEFKREFEELQKNSTVFAVTNDCSSVNIPDQNHCQREDSIGNSIFSSKFISVIKCVKLAILICCWITFSMILILTKEKKENIHLISVPNIGIKSMTLSNVFSDRISIVVEGSLMSETNTNSSFEFPQSYLTIWLELLRDENKNNNNRFVTDIQNASDTWILPVMSTDLNHPNQRRIKTFELNYLPEKLEDYLIAIKLKTNSNLSIPISLTYNLTPIDVNKGLFWGTSVLIGLYILIVFELVHRTIAALLASTSSIAVLAALNEKPSVSQLTSWVDFDTLMLLFSMMILVAIVAETGSFDYFAAFAYKITKGKVLPLVSTLCFFTAFVSAFLDNVTVIMLIIPVTIRLCEVMRLNPVPVITLMVMFSNIGGALTPVGDPPNIIIASNRRVIEAGVGFSTFTLHMGIGVLLALIILYGHFRVIFRNLDNMHFRKPQDDQELRCEIARWQSAVTSLENYNEQNNNTVARDVLLKKIKEVLQHLENKVANISVSVDDYETTIKELNEKYTIKDQWLLVKSGVCMTLVITLFFLHSSPNLHLSIGSSAFLCVLLLLILADNKSFDDLLARVEWSTLLFFAALFVLMEALTELGLITWIGSKTESIIMSVNEESRLAVAILLLLWVSAIAGAFVDNVPLATMMIRIVTEIGENSKLRLPLQPLVWALAFGACLGGNGTLIGATTNVVCAGVAEQHGYRVTFFQFFKIGFPVLITSTLTVSIYLMIAHVIFEWNY